MLNMLQSEWIKIKSTPFLYLILIASCFIPFIILLPMFIDAHNMVDLNRNPWSLHFQGIFSIFSVFVITPLIIMMVTTSDYIESQAKANKYRYCSAIKRSHFYFGKLLFLVLMVIFSFALLPLISILAGYVVNLFIPEYEYSYYSPELMNRLFFMKRIFIASLGILGIQYFLTLFFKHFIVPLGIGLIGYMISFILAALNSRFSIYLPFDYPLIVNDLKMFKNDQNQELIGSLLSKVEALSIITFIVFVLLGWLIEKNRNVTE